jgi:2-polyprenyl-3-methyl-5-hydroxy-6-metoxy-1,4-benzoquinol methylase
MNPGTPPNEFAAAVTSGPGTQPAPQAKSDLADRGTRMASEVSRHWEDVYTVNAVDQVSWFQLSPTTSVRLVTAFTHPGTGVIDVGAGASRLADELLGRGLLDVTVLDVSAQAVEAIRARLKDRTPSVTTIVADVLTWHPTRQYHLWHDRAVFHFLTAAQDRYQYVQTAQSSIRSGGHLVLGTFAADGPTRCSGLPTARYDVTALASLFDADFTLVHAEREEHRTPAGATQAFSWVVLRRR